MPASHCWRAIRSLHGYCEKRVRAWTVTVLWGYFVQCCLSNACERCILDSGAKCMGFGTISMWECMLHVACCSSSLHTLIVPMDTKPFHAACEEQAVTTVLHLQACIFQCRQRTQEPQPPCPELPLDLAQSFSMPKISSSL